MRVKKWRALGPLGAALVVGCLAACSTPSAPAVTPAATRVATPSPTPSEDPEAEILSAVHGFYEALATISHGDVDPAHFDGFATGAIVEKEIADGRHAVETGLLYEGEPTLSDITIEIDDDDAATVLLCVDNANWHPPEIDTTGKDMVRRGALIAERIDEAWLITDSFGAPDTFTC